MNNILIEVKNDGFVELNQQRSVSNGLIPNSNSKNKINLLKKKKNDLNEIESNQNDSLRSVMERVSELDFAEKLKDRLRRTVFYETKQMNKQRKRKNIYRISLMEHHSSYKGECQKIGNINLSNDRRTSKKQYSRIITPLKQKTKFTKKCTHNLDISKCHLLVRKHKINNDQRLNTMVDKIGGSVKNCDLLHKNRNKSKKQMQGICFSNLPIEPWSTLADSSR